MWKTSNPSINILTIQGFRITGTRKFRLDTQLAQDSLLGNVLYRTDIYTCFVEIISFNDFITHNLHDVIALRKREPGFGCFICSH